MTCSDEFNFATECDVTCKEGHYFVQPLLDMSQDEDSHSPSSSIRVECTEDKVWTFSDMPECTST